MALPQEEVLFILASRSKLRTSGFEHSLKIPVFVNQSIIKQGEELFFYVKEEEIVNEPATVQGFQVNSCKRAKVSSS